jgi:hypothetical protein
VRALVDGLAAGARATRRVSSPSGRGAEREPA